MGLADSRGKGSGGRPLLRAQPAGRAMLGAGAGDPGAANPPRDEEAAVSREAPGPAPLAEVPDEELMLLVARGFIREPATELFRRHNRALFNFVAWLSGGDLREAEDIAQTAWVRVMSRCADYQPTAAFRTFLFQIARNAWLDARGSAWSARREEMPEVPPEAHTELSPEAEYALRRDLDRVHRVLLTLPHPQREVVVLRFFADMNLDEIAQTVGVGFETAKSRLRYAYQSLRAALELTP